MIVKILPPSATFAAVRYNTDKMDREKGILMKASGFGALQGLGQLRPQDVVNYLEALSAANGRIKNPQFHAVISCKGRSHTAEQLTDIAMKWLEGMGYGNQPYLVVFHNDTANSHVHIVTTRVGRDGRKINDSFERLRAYEVLDRILGRDAKWGAEADVAKALGYTFATKAQFMLLLESMGYSIDQKDGRYRVCRNGREQASVPLADVEDRIAAYAMDVDRLAQLRAIVKKYGSSYSTDIHPVTVSQPGGHVAKQTGYTSELADLLREKFGVETLFHGKPGKPPYGYTIIDHARKTVYKGGELMPLAELGRYVAEERQPAPEWSQPPVVPYDVPAESGETLGSGPVAHGWEANARLEHAPDWPPADLIPEISGDIDDEAILGRNRRRKRKARTNTR